MPARDPKQYDHSWIRDRRLTLEEVCEYKKIKTLPPCLVCGRKLRYLASHLTTHGMTIDYYRNFYGLPRFMKLSDINVRNAKSIQSQELMQNGFIGGNLDQDAKKDLAYKMRNVPRNLNRPEIKRRIAMDNLRKVNIGKSGIVKRMQKLGSLHTREETKALRSFKNKERKSIDYVHLANKSRNYIKSKEHERRRIEVMRIRAEIIRITPEDSLPAVLKTFKEECRVERNRRIREKRQKQNQPQESTP